MTRTVAVLGAGGIGRHHANWWRLEGASVVAILGRTDASVALSAGKLQSLFGFNGAVYTDLDTLLREADPDIVDICTPAACHFAQAAAALRNGRQVLCEKPLVFDHALSTRELLAQATTLSELAHAGSLNFGLCSQFAIAARTCRELLATRTSAPLRRIGMELRSPVRGRPPNPAQTWIDLGPHLIAALQTLLPGAEPDWTSLRTAAAGHDADFAFTIKPAVGPAVTVQLDVGFTLGEPANVRRITLNDTAFDLIGEAGPDGHFRMRYHSSDGIDEPRPDPMRLLIREFLAGTPTLDAAAAMLNLTLLLRLLEAIPHAAAE